jgi:ABC-type nickel/cobalt efflux system permease component RcnA
VGYNARMLASAGGVLLGLLVGLRHAFEPDHLTAVSTLVTEASGARRGTILGIIWGLGHTAALVIVGALLLATGAALPARAESLFELAVALMLIVLGARALWLGARDGRRGATPPHRHGADWHAHAGPDEHLHLAGRTFALRPLLVGLVHGLAGSGALTALVFAELPDLPSRIVYIVLFGLGSVLGMAVASGAVGASLWRAAPTLHRQRAFAVASGALSIGLGIAWAIPELGAIA